jgi:diacylglycerol diphosphate phosphatase/phosphatidate phosphatase
MFIRTMDYRHHWEDVAVGSLVGVLFSFFSYRQYYPPLSSPESHLPYPPRYIRAPILTPSGPANGVPGVFDRGANDVEDVGGVEYTDDGEGLGAGGEQA